MKLTTLLFVACAITSSFANANARIEPVTDPLQKCLAEKVSNLAKEGRHPWTAKTIDGELVAFLKISDGTIRARKIKTASEADMVDEDGNTVVTSARYYDLSLDNSGYSTVGGLVGCDFEAMSKWNNRQIPSLDLRGAELKVTRDESEQLPDVLGEYCSGPSHYFKNGCPGHLPGR